jgi:3-hydroxyisobutyrate dehydrogenase-like beta-hydroxyacid dehydrogenase
MTSVAIVGLGMIGGGAARALARQPFELRGYDPRDEVFERLPAQVIRSASASAAADDATVVLIAVMDDAQVRTAVAGSSGILAAARPPGAIVILSTVTLETIRWAEEVAGARGVAVIDCGVSGGPDALEQAAVTAMVGGDSAAVEAARSVLEGFAEPVVHCGQLGNGMRAKLARNMITYGQWLVSWEATSLAIAAGVPRDRFIECVQASDVWLEGHLFLIEHRIGAGISETGATPEIGELVTTYASKDLRAAVALGGELGMALPAAELALARLPAVTASAPALDHRREPDVNQRSA